MSRPVTPPEQRFWPRVEKGDGCWEWTGSRDRDGYGKFQLKLDDGKVECRAHRASYCLNVGPIPPGRLVRHKCDNPPCVRPDHLELGDAGDNARDCHSRGRGTVGERHGRARLSDGQVAEIRSLATTMTHVEVARRFDVSPRYVGQLVSGDRRV